MDWRSFGEPRECRLVLALADIARFRRAAEGRPDREVFAFLDAFYRLAADHVARAGGKVVKAMGDGVLMVFSPDRAQEAVTELHALQHDAIGLWGKQGPPCEVMLKLHLGDVVAGPMQPEGRFDVIGRAVCDLFCMPAQGPHLSAELVHHLHL
ncbi:MAG: hypothetical protein JXR77_14490 [Lentisphaeria bacterium]|nr:hypothetical protein [Lentisphaeria bacterium]